MTMHSETEIGSESNSPMPQVILSIPGEVCSGSIELDCWLMYCPQRRRAQNRVAQRAHRERQKRYIADLESKFITLQSDFKELDKKYRLIQRDNEFLTSLLGSQQMPMAFSSLPRCTGPISSHPSGDLESGSQPPFCDEDFVFATKLEEIPQVQLSET